MPTTPTDAEFLTAATDELTAAAQPDIQPVITDRVSAILASVKLATTWVHNTAYVVGNVVMPTVRNGHKYRCIQAGTSAALLVNQPDWPVGASAVITEGVSDPILTWVEDGPELSQIYDVRKAIHKAWLEKAAKASLLYATSQSGSRFEHQQVYEHCNKQAEIYASIGIA